MAAIVGKRGEKAAEDKGKTAQVTKYCGRLPGCDCKCSWVVMHVVGIRKSHFFAVNGSRRTFYCLNFVIVTKQNKKAGIKNSKEFTEFLHQFSHNSSDYDTGV